MGGRRTVEAFDVKGYRVETKDFDHVRHRLQMSGMSSLDCWAYSLEQQMTRLSSCAAQMPQKVIALPGNGLCNLSQTDMKPERIQGRIMFRNGYFS